MTSIREHREYSSNVVRDLDSRPLSPYQTQFGSKLDLLLDDLQNSVSRPGSSLGQPISQSSQHVSFLQPANSTSFVRERSLSPTSGGGVGSGKQYYTATSKYEYKTSSGGGGSGSTTNLKNDDTVVRNKVYQQNISQLDNLLNDLERERDNSLDRHKSLQSPQIVQNTNIGIDSGLSDPSQGQKKIVKTTTFHESGKKTVARELLYDPPGTGSLRTSRPRTRSPGYDNRQLDLESQIVTDSALTNGSKRHEDYSSYSETSTLRNRSLTPKVHYSEHVEESGPEALQNLDLEREMLPPPGTKVTTTVRTYTYELPEEPDKGIINKKVTVKDEHTSKTTTLPFTPAERDIPLPLAIEAPPPTASLTTYRSDASYPSQIDGHPGHTTNKALYYKKETKSSNTSYYPGSPDPNSLPRLLGPGEGPVQTSYSETVTHGGPPGVSDPYGMNTITYRYNSSNQNTNIRYPPAEREPLLPAFPVEHDHSNLDGNPPKRVEDLMASFGDTTHSDTFHYIDKRHEVTEKHISPQRVEEKKKPFVPPKHEVELSKNVAGSPVYYPPNHEMFARKEESAGWQAGGGWAKGRGEYEYKAENRSKSSSKKGGAVVPVCLPLCCAMPCSIM